MAILSCFLKNPALLSGKVGTSHLGLFMCVSPIVGINGISRVWSGSENKTLVAPEGSH
jgi:hypothetical protein